MKNEKKDEHEMSNEMTLEYSKTYEFYPGTNSQPLLRMVLFIDVNTLGSHKVNCLYGKFATLHPFTVNISPCLLTEEEISNNDQEQGR